MADPPQSTDEKAEGDEKNSLHKSTEADNTDYLAGGDNLMSQRLTTGPAESTADSIPSADTERPTADSIPSMDTERPTADSIPSMDTEIPTANSIPSMDTEIPTADGIPSTDTEIPTADSLPSADTEIPTADSKPSVDTEGTTADSKPSVDTEISTADSIPNVDTEIPTTDSIPNVDTEIPTADSIPNVDTEIPTADSIPNVDTEIPTTDSIPNVDTEIPTADSIPNVDTERPTRNVDSNNDTRNSTDEVATNIVRGENTIEDAVDISLNDKVADLKGMERNSGISTPVGTDASSVDEDLVLRYEDDDDFADEPMSDHDINKLLDPEDEINQPEDCKDKDDDKTEKALTEEKKVQSNENQTQITDTQSKNEIKAVEVSSSQINEHEPVINKDVSVQLIDAKNDKALESEFLDASTSQMSPKSVKIVVEEPALNISGINKIINTEADVDSEKLTSTISAETSVMTENIDNSSALSTAPKITEEENKKIEESMDTDQPLDKIDSTEKITSTISAETSVMTENIDNSSALSTAPKNTEVENKKIEESMDMDQQLDKIDSIEKLTSTISAETSAMTENIDNSSALSTSPKNTEEKNKKIEESMDTDQLLDKIDSIEKLTSTISAETSVLTENIDNSSALSTAPKNTEEENKKIEESMVTDQPLDKIDSIIKDIDQIIDEKEPKPENTSSLKSIEGSPKTEIKTPVTEKDNENIISQTEESVHPAGVGKILEKSSVPMEEDISNESSKISKNDYNEDEMADSLGLLAESSRVMEDDEEQETSDQDQDQEQETSDNDDDDDFDPDDESSNQMIDQSEQSEDSNPTTSETDMPLKMTHQIIEKSNEAQYILQAEESCDIETTTEIQDLVEIAQSEEKEVFKESDDTFNFAISEVVSQMEKETVEQNADSMDVEETKIEESMDITTEQTEIPEPKTTVEDQKQIKPVQPTEQAETDTIKVSDTSDEDSAKEQNSVLKTLLREAENEEKTKSPVKKKKLEISKPRHIENIVDLEESSSEDESQDKLKDKLKSPLSKQSSPTGEKRKVDIQSDVKSIDVDITENDGDVSKTDVDVTKTDVDLAKADDSNDVGATEVDIVDDVEVSNDVDISDDVQITGDDVTNVNLPSDIDIMSSGVNISHITTKKGEIVISGVPRPTTKKTARLNTSEVSIKTVASTESKTETKVRDTSLMMSEVFNLDSDDEEGPPAEARKTPPAAPKKNKCINPQCTSDSTVPFYVADVSTRSYYESSQPQKKRPMVCQHCAFEVAMRQKRLVAGVKEFTPLLDLDMGNVCTELVTISDSDSDEETEQTEDKVEILGPETAKMIEEELVDMLNNTWRKFKMDILLEETQDVLTSEIDRLQKDSEEIKKILRECQQATDKLRLELYCSFDQKKNELEPIVIYHTPDADYTCDEKSDVERNLAIAANKRRLTSTSQPPAKRAAIPLGYTSLDDKQPATQPNAMLQAALAKPQAPPTNSVQPPLPNLSKQDEDKDVSVVQLSTEVAPSSLPPLGEILRPPVRAGMPVFAMRNAFGSWLKAKIVECYGKGPPPNAFTMCKVKFENKANKNAYKVLPARSLAYPDPATVRMTIGTRIIALFKDKTAGVKRESFYSGVVAEVPNPVNKYRYLVFFDDGYAQYVHHKDTRLVCEFSSLVWEEVHPFSREFVKDYLLAYPERPMVRLHTGQNLKAEWNGKWWACRVMEVDASLVQVLFESDERREWIYRGSTRLAPLYLELQAAERHRARPMPRNRLANKPNMPYVEYTRSDEQEAAKAAEVAKVAQQEVPPTDSAKRATDYERVIDEMRRQRAVAKKSTTQSSMQSTAPPPPQPPGGNLDTVTSRVVYYTPKNAVRPHKMVPHQCSTRCRRTDTLALADLRTYNPLAKPLLSGWERQIVRFRGHKEVMYRAPCGRRIRDMRELHRYLRLVHSDMGVDLFDFTPTTHCLAEFVLNKCIVGKKDLSHGKENVPVPCVNYYDDSLPEFCSYNTERTPTAGVPLNLDPDFLCGCDCTDDCEDKSKCACWRMTLEGARTIGLDDDVGYVYKRLPEPLPSGIYECNARCKCKSTCLNRVAQHPLQLKLQVFKTLNRGWGIRALNDVPKGAFLCVYAGNLLTDATANLDGLNEGDEYLAELDYIEVVEQMKEGFEEDIPDADKELDRKESKKSSSSSSEEESPSSEEEVSDEKRDDDFQPGYIGAGLTEFSKRLRKRNKKKEKDEKSEEKDKKEKDSNSNDDDCITISDDEEVREPSRFAAQLSVGKELVSKYRSVRSYFGEDEACYIMDAKVQGNIGRYLNHSCSPNVFVQNVFVDTHDPRFPWVAFFALTHIRAGTELTWNYNYDVGSVPGKILYCFCGATNCRGRLL